jgi:hypothetical protein
MSNTQTKPIHASAVHDPRQTFETAIAQIQHCGKPLNASRIPIAVRRQTPEPGNKTTEKRALTEAARALARLWNVSPTMAR